MFVLIWLEGVSYINLFGPMTVFTFGRGLHQPNAQSSALNSVRAATGTASGMLGFVQLSIGAIVAQISSFFFQSSVLMLPSILILASIGALWSFEIGKKLFKDSVN